MWLEISSCVGWDDVSKLLYEREFMVCWNLVDIGYCSGVCVLSFVLYFLDQVLMSIPLFSILEDVVSGHTVKPYLPRHGLACILVPVLLSCVHLPFVIFHYNHE